MVVGKKVTMYDKQSQGSAWSPDAGLAPAQTPVVLGVSSSPSDPAWSGDAEMSVPGQAHVQKRTVCPTVPFHRGPQAASQDADARGLGHLFPRSWSRFWAQST